MCIQNFALETWNKETVVKAWPYTEAAWLYCGFWRVSCSVVVLTCFVMCGCVCFVTRGCVYVRILKCVDVFMGML